MALNQKLQLSSFDPGQETAEESFSEAQLEAARAEAHAAGREAALAEHLTTEERRIADMLEQVMSNAAKLADEVDKTVTELTNEVLDIAMLAVRKVLPTMAATNGLAEIEGLVRSCLTDLRAEPRVAIRLHMITLEALQPRLERIASASGFDGKLLLLADDDLAPTDCQVLWADGGAARKYQDITGTIDAAVARFLDRDAPDDDGDDAPNDDGDDNAQPGVSVGGQPPTDAPIEDAADNAPHDPLDAAPRDAEPLGDAPLDAEPLGDTTPPTPPILETAHDTEPS